MIHNLTGLGLDPPEGDDNIFFPVLPQRQGGVVFQPSLLGQQLTQVYSVHIYRPPGLGKPVTRTASNAVRFPACKRLPQDSIVLEVTPKALPKETSGAWMWLKALALLPRVLGSNPRTDTSLSLSLYYCFVNKDNMLNKS